MTMKANRSITHRRRFKDTADLVENFYNRADLLKDKLGCILFQTPPPFRNNDENYTRLKKFLESLNSNYKNVFEFRHESWWDEQVYNLLTNYNCGFCTVSGLNMPNSVQLTSNIAYFRFHGPQEAYASKYSQ